MRRQKKHGIYFYSNQNTREQDGDAHSSISGANTHSEMMMMISDD